VKPYVKSNKNDQNDAEAICEAVSRPSMRFVPPKSADQLTMQAVHRIRQRLIGDRVRLVNQIRGLLSEHGIVVARDIAQLRKHLANKNARIVWAMLSGNEDYEMHRSVGEAVA
jgi:transposase